MRSRRFHEVLGKLAAAEERFLHSEFLAPVVRDGEVRVRIAGVVARLLVTPAGFEGWGVFQPVSHTEARLVREAGLAERRRYLELFPLVRLILAVREQGHWLAMPAHRGDARLRIDGLVPLRLVEEAQQFEVVRARFDGAQFWFEGPEAARDPATAAWLRSSLKASVPPDRLERTGLTAEERSAYAANCAAIEAVQQQNEAAQAEQKLQDALRHAGAELVGYLERRDGYRVTYRIGGREHVSAVRKDDLAVQVAGICLSGQDRAFDLTSLVGVLREAEQGGAVVPVGPENLGMAEDDYWDVHPPEDE